MTLNVYLYIICSNVSRIAARYLPERLDARTMCMFDVLEAMLAGLRSRRNADMFWHVSLWPNMGRGLVHV